MSDEVILFCLLSCVCFVIVNEPFFFFFFFYCCEPGGSGAFRGVLEVDRFGDGEEMRWEVSVEVMTIDVVEEGDMVFLFCVRMDVLDLMVLFLFVVLGDLFKVV